MENSKIIIAIDGHSSTGKSSFAKIIASKLGYIYIDTGAMYRAITYFAYNNGFINDSNKIDRTGLKKTLNKIEITFKPDENGKSHTFLNNANIDKQIRSLEISNMVSYISAVGFVREYVDSILHKFGTEKGVVMDGRDIGTAVFPNAEFKIFMTASANVRAQRRFKEMQESGQNESFDEILKNIKERDFIDENRDVAPLRRADDAILLDNGDMTMEQEIEWVSGILKEKFNIVL